MSQDQLTHTINFRVSPNFRDEVAAAAESEDITVGEFVRRAIRAEIDAAAGRRLDPHLAITLAQTETHIVEALQAIGSPERSAGLVHAVDGHLGDVLEAVVQANNVLDDETAHQRFERVSGYLRQASEDLLHAASRVKSIRFANAIARGDLEREITRLEAGGADRAS